MISSNHKLTLAITTILGGCAGSLALADTGANVDGIQEITVLRALTMAYVVGDVVVISQNTLSPTHARSTPLNATKSQNDELSNESGS